MGAHQRPTTRSARTAWSHGKRQPAVRGCSALTLQSRYPLAGPTRALWRFPRRAHPQLALEQERRVATDIRDLGTGRGQRVRNDRRHHRARPPAERRCKKGGRKAGALGRSRGGLSTKIHTTVDALGNPTGSLLMPGQAHDLTPGAVLA